jgi:hypothetical protein
MKNVTEGKEKEPEKTPGGGFKSTIFHLKMKKKREE